MTKKYWKDWQSKKDKTRQVEYWNYFLDMYRYSKWAINIINGDKIVDIQFHGEAVDIIVDDKLTLDDIRMLARHILTDEQLAEIGL